MMVRRLTTAVMPVAVGLFRVVGMRLDLGHGNLQEPRNGSTAERLEAPYRRLTWGYAPRFLAPGTLPEATNMQSAESHRLEAIVRSSSVSQAVASCCVTSPRSTASEA